MAKKILTAADILGADDLHPVEVDIPEWGGTILLRALSADEAMEFVDLFADPARRKEGSIRITIASAVNEDGERLFTNDQYDNLKKHSMKPFMRLQEVALRLNGFTEEGKESAKNG